jgi:hypothetical protein
MHIMRKSDFKDNMETLLRGRRGIVRYTRIVDQLY